MNKTLSLSPDVNNPGYRAVTFDEVVEAYSEQVRGLMDGDGFGNDYRCKRKNTERADSGSISEFCFACEPLSVGLNCALGAKEMRPYLEELSAKAPFFISCYPNAGLPNQFGEYDETPETMCTQIDDFLASGFINIVGGCCGTTPRSEE